MTCEGFKENHGHNISPKNVLIHIGTRDSQKSHGVINKQYGNLYAKAIETWPQAKIYIMPIIKRKDVNTEAIDQANLALAEECTKFENITLLNKFNPQDDTFHDKVHLNNKKGLPAIVKHLKFSMKMYPKEQTFRNCLTKGTAPSRGAPHNATQAFPLSRKSCHI